jgi:hypothetical protein
MDREIWQPEHQLDLKYATFKNFLIVPLKAVVRQIGASSRQTQVYPLSGPEENNCFFRAFFPLRMAPPKELIITEA